MLPSRGVCRYCMHARWMYRDHRFLSGEHHSPGPSPPFASSFFLSSIEGACREIRIHVASSPPPHLQNPPPLASRRMLDAKKSDAKSNCPNLSVSITAIAAEHRSRSAPKCLPLLYRQSVSIAIYLAKTPCQSSRQSRFPFSLYLTHTSHSAVLLSLPSPRPRCFFCARRSARVT